MVTTATSIRTLVVNSAFMQELKDGNPNLAHAVKNLRHVCGSNEKISQVSRQLTKVLNALRMELALQFALEESYGYVEVNESELHDLSEMAETTRAQHHTLYSAVTELAEAAEELQYRGVEPEQLRVLLDETCEFSRQLYLHEQAENDLIDQSFKIR